MGGNEKKPPYTTQNTPKPTGNARKPRKTHFRRTFSHKPRPETAQLGPKSAGSSFVSRSKKCATAAETRPLVDETTGNDERGKERRCVCVGVRSRRTERERANEQQINYVFSFERAGECVCVWTIVNVVLRAIIGSSLTAQCW